MAQKVPIIVDGLIGSVPMNCYPAKDSERGVLLHGSPGLKSICQLPSCSEVRGLLPYVDSSGNKYLFAVAARGSTSVLWRSDPQGNYAEIGVIPTSNAGPVWMINNYRDVGDQILITDGVWGYVYTPANNQFIKISDPNFPGGGPCTFQDGYALIVQPNSPYFFNSSNGDFTTYFTTPNGGYVNDSYAKESGTDNIAGILSDHLEVWVGGQLYEFEVWNDAGGGNTSPSDPRFARNAGGEIAYGLGGADTLKSVNNAPAWLTTQGQLLWAPGYSPQIISNDMFGRAIHGDPALFMAPMPTISDARAFAYVDQEHTFLQVNFPSGNQTWVYDFKTNLFHQKSSYLDSGPGWGRHRANCYAFLSPKHYVGDFSSGDIYEMSNEYLDDNGHASPMTIYFPEILGNAMKPVSIPDLQIEYETGVGLETGTLNPQAMLQVSKDGGKTWGPERWRSLGAIGEYKTRCIWRMNGMARSGRALIRVTVTDSVVKKILSVDWGTPQ